MCVCLCVDTTDNLRDSSPSNCLSEYPSLRWSLSPSRGWRSPGGNTRRLQPTCTEELRTWALNSLSLIGWDRHAQRQGVRLILCHWCNGTKNNVKGPRVILWHVLQDLRLPSVTTIAIPEGYNWREMLAYMMKHHQMEMTGGLGPSVDMVGCCLKNNALCCVKCNQLTFVKLSTSVSMSGQSWSNTESRVVTLFSQTHVAKSLKGLLHYTSAISFH